MLTPYAVMVIADSIIAALTLACHCFGFDYVSFYFKSLVLRNSLAVYTDRTFPSFRVLLGGFGISTSAFRNIIKIAAPLTFRSDY